MRTPMSNTWAMAGLFVFLLSVSWGVNASQEGATYVGSESCQKCHQKIYKTWKQTLHAQMSTDVSKNPNAIVGDFETPSDIRTFGKEGIIYTIGNQWKQRYIIKKDDEMYILPAQYNLETGRWAPYHPKDWDQRPWLKKCGSCHVTGLNYEARAASTWSKSARPWSRPRSPIRPIWRSGCRSRSVVPATRVARTRLAHTAIRSASSPV